MSLTCSCGRRMSCTDSRAADNNTTRRRYSCTCGARLTTREEVVDDHGRTAGEGRQYQCGLADGMEKMLEKLREFARKESTR